MLRACCLLLRSDACPTGLCQVYDDGSCTTAARVWWALVAYGHPAAAVLAGGWRAWQAAGGQGELYEPCPLKVGRGQGSRRGAGAPQ